MAPRREYDLGLPEIHNMSVHSSDSDDSGVRCEKRTRLGDYNCAGRLGDDEARDRDQQEAHAESVHTSNENKMSCRERQGASLQDN